MTSGTVARRFVAGREEVLGSALPHPHQNKCIHTSLGGSYYICANIREFAVAG